MPKLDHVGAARDQRVEIGRGIAVARGDKGDECGAALAESGGDAGGHNPSSLRVG